MREKPSAGWRTRTGCRLRLRQRKSDRPASGGSLAGAILLVGISLTTAGCHRTQTSSGNVITAVRIEPAPIRAGKVRAIVTLTDRGRHTPLTGAHVSVEGDMTHAGMVPVFGAAAETKPGSYEAPMTLSMPGDWVLTITAALPDGGLVRHEFPLPGVSPS